VSLHQPSGGGSGASVADGAGAYSLCLEDAVPACLVEYPYLEREDILQALRYAAWRTEEREVVLADTKSFS
jgi:uncharacterized protein (DUF433 family)